MEIVKIVIYVITGFSLFIVIVQRTAAYFSRFLNWVPWHYYLDKEMDRYSRIYKDVEDKEIKDWFITQLRFLSKQKTALIAINRTFPRGILAIMACIIYFIGSIFYCFLILPKESGTCSLVIEYFCVIVISVGSVYFLGRFICLRAKRGEVYRFYLNMLDTKYQKIVIHTPEKLYNNFYKNLSKMDKVFLYLAVVEKDKTIIDKTVKSFDEESKKEADNGGETQC